MAKSEGKLAQLRAMREAAAAGGVDTAVVALKKSVKVAHRGLVVGEECPSCGQVVKRPPRSAAEKQKAYRARKVKQ